MRTTLCALAFILVCSAAAPSQETSTSSLPVGTQAPDFALPFATRDSVGFGDVSLSSFLGKNVVLAFYPADWSGGCTREVCSFRDNFAALIELNTVVLAVSGDYPYSHHEWAKFHSLPFLLLSDHKHKVAGTYHSYNESTGYNRRTVYLIDARGAIAYADMEYSTRDTASLDKLKAALAKLKDNNKH